ncbi:MAG TPA: hypothetical protein VFT12_11855 [Thermoanaerobaculia bacterium]|nr:hypothetical protein [Thermoanaerobaculia bacterium]
MRVERTALFAWLLLVAGCGMLGGGSKKPSPEPPPPPFVNRVWRVVEATEVPVGSYYSFLSDNTLLVTRPGATTPDLLRWHSAAGGLVIIEEGYRFPTDILEQGAERFSIRLHRRGGTDDVVMVPAGEAVTPPVPSSSSPGGA